MSQDDVRAQLQTGSVEIFHSLLEALISILSDFIADSSGDLLDVLKGLKEVYKSAPNEASKREFADLVATDEPVGICSAIYGFISKVFSELGKGVDGVVGHSMLLLHHYLMSWTDVSKRLCSKLFSDGHLLQHFFEIEELSNSLADDKFARNLLLINISIIYNCKEENLKYYFQNTKCLSALVPFLACAQWDLQFHCRVILCSVVKAGGDIDAKLTKLSEEELKILSQLLETVAHSAEHFVSIENYSFTAIELLSCVNLLSVSDDNLSAFRNSNKFISTIPCFLTSATDIIEITLQILWKLLLPDSQDILGDHRSSIVDRISGFSKNYNDSMVPLLSECVLYILKNSTSKDVSSQLKYATGCYQFGHFHHCYQLCNAIMEKNHSNEVTNQAFLLKGKSAFHLYTLQKSIPKNLSAKEYHQRHSSCYAKAREAIVTLGKALDLNTIDKEGSKMLDIAMMDYILATNNLKDIRRCLLCRRRVEKKILIRSHFCPKSLLSAYAEGIIRPENQRVIDTKLSAIGQTKSPKEMTYFMYCSDCEDIFSKYGETQFMPEFFRVIYDVENPVQTGDRVVHYKEWLHQFCIGVIFRGMSLMSSREIVINEDELYKVFTVCREYLLGLNTSNQLTCELPDIYILINPTTARPEDNGFVFMNQILHALCMYGVGHFDLCTGHDSFPHQAHYFFFHTGTINIIFKLSPSQNASFPDAYLIHRAGGDYCIPEDKKCSDTIPVGIWKLFQSSSVKFYQCWLERSSKTKVTGTMIMPDEKVEMVYGMVNAVEKDLESTSNVINPVPGATLVINLLPKEIVFVHNTLMKLPEGHKMLLHLHFDLKDGDGEIVFLATSSAKEYSNRPYVIYQFYSPKLVMNAGFFINVHDMTAAEFLPSSDDPKMILDKLQNIANVRKLMPTVIPLMLKERGFASLHSLLNRTSSPERSPTSVDLKCSTVQRCWYCSNLCEICLKDAVYGLTVHHRNGMLLKFCSKECQQQHTSPASLPLLVKVFSPNQVPDNFMSYSRKIQEGHTELLFIQGYRSDPAGNHIKIDIALCSGDGSEDFPKNCMYIVYYHRSTFSQQFVEYFVTKEMAPLQMLPYYGKISLHDILGNTLSESIKIFVTKAIVAHNLPLDVALSNLSIEGEDCSTDKEKISSSVSSNNLNPTSLGEENPIIKIFQFACTQMEGKVVSEAQLKNVSDVLMNVRDIFTKASPQLRSTMADSMVDFIEPIKTFHSFLEMLFEAIVDGKATEELVQCFQLQQCLLMGFTDSSEQFCDLLLYHGLICHQIDQILMLRQSDPNSFIDLLLSLAVGIIYNCRMSELFLVYFEDKDCSFFVKPYLNSSNFTIAFQCKATLAVFSVQLSEARHMLAMSEKEVDKILMLIGDALHSPELLTSCEHASFSTLELLMSLTALLINADNRLLLCTKAELIPIIITALTSGDIGIETTSCLLLWNMLELFTDSFVAAKPSSKKQKAKKEFLLEAEKDTIAKKQASHSQFIKSLKDSELCDVLYGTLEGKADSEEDIGVLCKCILWTLRGINFSDDKHVLIYMEQCLKYGRYQECLNCYHITFGKAPLSDRLNKAKYLAGKSCFYLYREKQRQLQFVSLSPAVLYQYKDSFCVLMFETVKFLGVSFDQGLLLKDEKWMLDRAMIDYVHATNNLKDCMRCLLCLKKARDIRRSHYCPRQILERFASGCYMPHNMKAVLSLHEGNVVSCDTPKTETFYMFCSSCEDVLSQNGETQFLPKFFDKLYDAADLKETTISGPASTGNNATQDGVNVVPSNSASDSINPAPESNATESLGSHDQNPTTAVNVSNVASAISVASSNEPLHFSQSKDIVYDRWLYLFCIGIVFRGIVYMSRKSYVNSNDLYDLLVKCRECLLKAPHIDDVESLPVVEILISPSSPNPGDEKHGFIHSAMRMLYQFAIGITNLQTGVFSFPQKVHFVLAQIGIINILVKLPPSYDIPAQPECVISSAEGVHVYHVPASEERRSLFYEGIWEVIQSTAQELMEAWWQRSTQLYPQETHEPPDDVMDLYNIEASGFTDLNDLDGKILAAQPSSLQPTTLDFLPEGYHLDSSLHIVRFPDGHRIVAHKCFVEEPIKMVYFIAVGQIGVYNAIKPYAVVHFSAPGVVIKVGFFVDLKELVALDFLPDKKTREMIHDIKAIEKIRSNLHNNVLLLLQEKGFCSLVSLLECHSRFIVDTKCDAAAVCWYCQDLCEKCLKPATHAFNTVYEKHTYTFCSVDCKDSCFGNQEEYTFKFDDSVRDNAIQLEGHIFGLNEMPTFVNIKVSADKKLTILCYERSLKSQLYFQVLCNKTFEILNPAIIDDWLASETDVKDRQIKILQSMADKLKMSHILTIVYQKLLESNETLMQWLECIQTETQLS